MTRVYETNPGILEHAKASINSFFGYIMHLTVGGQLCRFLKK
jgi:hypothetical protein